MSESSGTAGKAILMRGLWTPQKGLGPSGLVPNTNIDLLELRELFKELHHAFWCQEGISMEDATSSQLQQQKGTCQQVRNSAEDSIHMHSHCVDGTQAQSSVLTGTTTSAHQRPNTLEAPESKISSAGVVHREAQCFSLISGSGIMGFSPAGHEHWEGLCHQVKSCGKRSAGFTASGMTRKMLTGFSLRPCRTQESEPQLL